VTKVMRCDTDWLTRDGRQCNVV